MAFRYTAGRLRPRQAKPGTVVKIAEDAFFKQGQLGRIVSGSKENTVAGCVHLKTKEGTLCQMPLELLQPASEDETREFLGLSR